MVTGAALSRDRQGMLLWLTVAVGAGVAMAFLPLVAAAGLLVSIALMLMVLIEPVLALVVMLLVAPLKTLIETEAPLTLPLDPGMLGLALVVFTWGTWRVRLAHAEPLPRSRVFGPIIVIMVAFSVSLLTATSVSAWMTELLKWGSILLLVLIVLDVGRDVRYQWIAFGVVLAGVVQAVVGLYEFFGGAGAPHLWIADYRFFRAFGTFGQPNPFSAFMGLTLPLALGLTWGYLLQTVVCWRAKAHWHTAGVIAGVYAVFSALLFAGLIASWGRGAWLGFGAAGTVMVFFAPPRRWQSLLLLGAGGMTVLLLWTAGLIPASIEARVDSTLTEFTGFQDVRGVYVSSENYAIVERLAHWQAALNMADASPLVGVGAGNFEAVYSSYGVPSWPLALGHAHNDYLNILAETGVIGLIAYSTAWVTLVYWTIRAHQQKDPVLHGLVIGLLGTWTHLVVHSVFDKLYVNNLFLHIGVMLGLLAIGVQHHQFLGVNDEHSDF